MKPKKKKRINRKITFCKIHDRIYHLKFYDQYYLNFCLMRIACFYESCTLAGDHFTLEQCIDDYVEFRGKFSYFEDWGGYNLPSSVFRVFFKKFKKDLTEKELVIQKLLDRIPNWRRKKFYVIATHKKSYDRHEIAHAMYMLFPDYREEMDELTQKCTYKQHMTSRLIAAGYNVIVADDEIQAYFATSTDDYLAEHWGVVSKDVAPPFRRVFEKYRKKYFG